ncbi:MAG: GNAT family N-acetyltransferase [Bacteroidota bacterium]
MHLIKTKSLNENQFNQINELWNMEYPENLKGRFPVLLDGVINYNHYLFEDENNQVMAWAVDFEKENEIRFSIIVAELFQSRGLGSQLMNCLKETHPQFYGWVIDHDQFKKSNGGNYLSPVGFYLRIGLVLMPECRIDNEIINAVKMKWEG